MILAATLAACSTAPPPQQPLPLALEIPETWASSPSPSPSPAHPPPGGALENPWWASFADDRLDALIREAFRSNHDLAAAAARVRQAQAEARIAGAALKPTVDVGTTGSRIRQNFIGFPIPGSERDVLTTTSSSIGLSLDVSWEPDLWNRLGASAAAALSDLEATAEDYAAAHLSLSAQTARTWIALAEAGEQTQLAVETVANRARAEERVRRRYEQGLRNALDLRLAVASHATARALLAARRRQMDAAQRQLEILLGRYPGAAVAAGPLPELPAPPPAGLPSELLERRPDLLAAERRLGAAGARVEQARAALLPRLRLTASGGRRSAELENLLDGSFNVWSLVAGLVQPLVAGGRLRAGVELSQARLTEAARHLAQTALVAFGEVESALAAEGFLVAQTEALATAAVQAKAAQQLAEDRYAAGLVDYLSVLESQRQALQAESDLLAAKRQRLDARIDLHLALGGGFEPPAADPAPGATPTISQASQGTTSP